MGPVSLNDRVIRIRNDEAQVNIFIEEFKPFIAACTQKVVGRYVRFGEDDELSVALMAFSEAIKSYDISRGSFLSLAKSVISRRLVDYYRKERKHLMVVSINEYSGEDGEETDLSTQESIDRYMQEEISEYRRMELEQLKAELKQWDISFIELAEASPKHDKTRRIYSDIIDFLTSRPELIAQIKQKKYLPVAEIENTTKIPRKTIDRARKYLIAVIIIITGDYQYVRSYINW